MRAVIAILFVTLSAFVGYYFARSVFDTFAGFVYVIVLFLLAAVLYLLFFNLLLKIVAPEEKNSHRTSSERKEYIFAISLSFSAMMVNIADFHYKNRHSEITDIVLEKIVLTGRRGALYCHEVELESGITQCVHPQCWHKAEKGNNIIITPSFGIFRLPKLDVPCVVT